MVPELMREWEGDRRHARRCAAIGCPRFPEEEVGVDSFIGEGPSLECDGVTSCLNFFQSEPRS